MGSAVATTRYRSLSRKGKTLNFRAMLAGRSLAAVGSVREKSAT